jgi:hypothetical protein
MKKATIILQNDKFLGRQGLHTEFWWRNFMEMSTSESGERDER